MMGWALVIELLLAALPHTAQARPTALQVFDEPLALPQDILSGFSLSDVEVCNTDCNHRFFRLRYSHADGRCYVYSGSWAESPRYSLQYVVPVEIPLLGWAYFTFGYLDRQGNFYEPSPELLNQSQPNLRSGWLGSNPYFQLESGLSSYPDQPPRYIGDCEGGITPNEAIQVMQSLVFSD